MKVLEDGEFKMFITFLDIYPNRGSNTFEYSNINLCFFAVTKVGSELEELPQRFDARHIRHSIPYRDRSNSITLCTFLAEGQVFAFCSPSFSAPKLQFWLLAFLVICAAGSLHDIESAWPLGSFRHAFWAQNSLPPGLCISKVEISLIAVEKNCLLSGKLDDSGIRRFGIDKLYGTSWLDFVGSFCLSPITRNEERWLSLYNVDRWEARFAFLLFC